MNDVPEYLRNRPRRGITADATAGLGSARPPWISRNGGRFTLYDGAGNAKPTALTDNEHGYYLDMVIVDANPSSRQYYERGYDRDNPGPPDCFSDNGTGPSVLSRNPQARTCAECNLKGWDTAISPLTGKPIPACTSIKKLAVIVADDTTPELVYEFQVPPGSWGDKEHGWKRYSTSIQSAMIGDQRAELSDVITRVYFVPGKTGVLGFTATGVITPELAEIQDAVWAKGEDETARVCGKLDKARDPALPLASKPQAIGAPPQQEQTPPPPRGNGPAKLVVSPAPSLTKRPPGRPRKDTATPETPPFLTQPEAVEASTPADKNATSKSQAGMAMPRTPDEAVKAAIAQAFNDK